MLFNSYEFIFLFFPLSVVGFFVVARFFPQLIAGLIVHHRDMIPQFMRAENLIPRWSNFAVGISIFAIGLFKKTVIADSLLRHVGPVYDEGTLGSEIDYSGSVEARVPIPFSRTSIIPAILIWPSGPREYLACACP